MDVVEVEAGFNWVASFGTDLWGKKTRHYLMRSASDHCQSAFGMKKKRQRQQAALFRRGVVPAHTASAKMEARCAT